MKAAIDAILRPEQAQYLEGLIPDRDETAIAIEADAAQHDVPIVDPEVGRFLEIVARSIGARRILEVGTATGYSGLHLLRGLPVEGELVTIDVDEDRQRAARGYWDRAGVAARATMHLGPALEVLPTLEGPFDLVFLDAIKDEYVRYLNLSLPMLRSGGIVVADNVLRGGRVATGEPDENADALRAFNAYAVGHPQLLAVILPLGDGLLYAAKLGE